MTMGAKTVPASLTEAAARSNVIWNTSGDGSEAGSSSRHIPYREYFQATNRTLPTPAELMQEYLVSSKVR